MGAPLKFIEAPGNRQGNLTGLIVSTGLRFPQCSSPCLQLWTLLEQEESQTELVVVPPSDHLAAVQPRHAASGVWRAIPSKMAGPRTGQTDLLLLLCYNDKKHSNAKNFIFFSYTTFAG